MMFKSIVAIVIYLLTSLAMARPEPTLRYVGTLSNQITKMQQLVKLDLIPIPKGDRLTYTAFLTLYLGDFESKEYVTYHFDEGIFDLQTSNIIFDQDDQAVSFYVKNRDENSLKGELKANITGKVGDIELSKVDAAKIQKPLSPQLSGEFKGTCSGKETTLQIQTMRSTDDTVRVGNPFGAFMVKAQWAEPFTRDGCYGVNAPCVKYTYEDGTYNFFTGELTLLGRVKNLRCMVMADQISCNSCILKAVEKKSLKVEYRFPSAQPFWDEVDTGTLNQDDVFEGHYLGLLHHEYLDTYQNISLEITDFPITEDRSRSLIISAVAKLYFGDLSSRETIYYRFKQARYNPIRNTIFLENMERDIDAFLVLEDVANGEIKGTWFSILFGRVGSFILSKNQLPAASSPLKMMDSLSGNYQSSKWNISLTIARESTPLNTQNPFFPLNFRGFTHLQNIVDYNPIESGSYDFYTGKIGILLKDGSAFFGDRKNNTTLSLKRPSPGVLRPLLSNSFLDYKKIGE